MAVPQFCGMSLVYFYFLCWCGNDPNTDVTTGLTARISENAKKTSEMVLGPECPFFWSDVIYPEEVFLLFRRLWSTLPLRSGLTLNVGLRFHSDAIWMVALDGWLQDGCLPSVRVQ